MKFWAFLLGFLAIATPAEARWYEASTDHFVIYADDSEKDVREYAENLERYQAALVRLTGFNVEKPSPSNRVTIFVVGSQRDIRKLHGGENRYVAGFYIPRAGGSRAFVQDIRMRSGYADFSTVVLLHEYAHHFLMSAQSYAMPRWANEGAAEFFASASFNRDGSLGIGRPALHRAAELAYERDVPIEQLLDQQLYDSKKPNGFDAFYGRSWALYHYLFFSDERAGQFRDYINRVVAGEASIDAGRAAFGDLRKLDREVDRYLRQRSMTSLKLDGEIIAIGAVNMRELPEGEAEAMPLRIRSQRGVDREVAGEIVVEARALAQRFPDDPGVLTVLAEAEFDAGNDAAAISAADAALAIDPMRRNAYVQKGFAMFRMAGASDNPDADYNAAMAPFSALNRIENDHPLPLVYYYRSVRLRGKPMTDVARRAIEHALELAPFDRKLALETATMQMEEGKIALAKRTLDPIVNDPHGGPLTSVAAALLSLLEKIPEGTSIKAPSMPEPDDE